MCSSTFSLFCLFFAVLIQNRIRAQQPQDGKIVYKAAVLEMIPFQNRQVSPLENELENVRVMIAYAIQAKRAGADIMVFPEQALTNGAPTDRQRFHRFTLMVSDPDEERIFCQTDNPRKAKDPICQMSFAAKSLKMYLVFNVPERVRCNPYREPDCKDGFYVYNTNVVFDRKGALVAKYRKQNMLEPQFDVGNNSKFNDSFTTDFGVTFGQGIGTDIKYYHPSVQNFEKNGIRDFVMPTTWIDSLPFDTAPQAQYSWSRGLGVNLLAAGIHEPGVGAAGSGIYTGASDILKSVYIYDDDLGARVLINSVTTVKATGNFTKTENNTKSTIPDSTTSLPSVKKEGQQQKISDNHLFLGEELEEKYDSDYIFGFSEGTTTGIYRPDSNETIEYEIFYDVEGEGSYFYFTYSGLTGTSDCKQYNQVLAFVYCPNGESSCGKAPIVKPANSTFKHLNVTATFQVPHVFPSVNNQDLQLVGEDSWSFTSTRDGNRATVSLNFLKPIEFLYSVTLIGRWYEKDPEC